MTSVTPDRAEIYTFRHISRHDHQREAANSNWRFHRKVTISLAVSFASDLEKYACTERRASVASPNPEDEKLVYYVLTCRRKTD